MSSPIITYRSNMGVQTTPPFSNTYSLSFDGVDDYVSAPQSFLNSASVFSVSFWAKKVLASDDVLIGDKISTFQGAWVNWYTDGNVYFTCRTGSNITLVAALSFDTNWHHFLCTKNGTDAKIYIDGVLSAITPTNGTVAITLPATCGDNFRIGSIDASTFGNSTIDEVALWDSVIAIGDVWDGSGQPTDLSLLATPPTAWYRMGENGAYKSPQWLLPSNENKDKVSNYSFQLDGVDDYINCGNPTDLQITGAFTLSVWTKLDSTVGTQACAISKDNGTSERAFTLWSKIVDKPVFYIWNGATSYNVGGTTNIADDTWHHVAVVYVPSTSIRIYVDGVLEGTNTTSIPASINNANYDFKIGEFAGSLFEFKGLMDEVSVFNSAVDIATLYNSGTPTTLPSGAVAHYKMGEEANFTSNWLVDNSALTNYSKRSFDFDGVDDYVDCGSLSTLQNATEFSISCWFKPELTAVNGIWTWFDGADGWLELNCSADGSMVANVTRFNHTSATYGIAAAGTLTADTWYNATVVFDGSGATNADRLKLYVNGNLITLTFIGTIPTQTGTMLSSGLHIGERFNGQNYFNGNIDEVSIFDSAISIGDVWDGSGEPIDVSAVSGLTNNWRMGEDASFNGTNWTVPDNLGTSTGTSANMTVDALVGEAPNYSGGGISNGMTIEDRVGEAPNSTSNALSFNMESVDRTTDVPT